MLNIFNTLTLNLIFWKTKTFSKKVGYRFLVESNKIENATFSSFASSFYFFENFVSVWQRVVKSWFDVPATQMSIFLLIASAGVSFEAAFAPRVSPTRFLETLILPEILCKVLFKRIFIFYLF